MPTLHQKLHAVMKLVSHVDKDKTVGYGKNAYDAATYNEVLRKVRQHFVDQGVIVFTRQVTPGELIKTGTFTSGGSEIMLYKAMYEVDIVNVDDPADKITEPFESTALDQGDKAPGKAQTYATKAALKKALMLIDADGEDDESRVNGTTQPTNDTDGGDKREPIKQPQAKSEKPKPKSAGKPITSGQVKFLERKIADANLKVADVVKTLGVKTLADITDANWKDAVAACSKAA